MAEILFRPNDPEEEEHAEVYLQAPACIAYLQSQVQSYSFADDRNLLKWVERACDHDVIPEKYWNRARFIVDELRSNDQVCKIVCRICANRVESSDISTDEWDGVDPKGDFLGGAGHRLLCGQGHPLLFIITRIY